MQTDSSLVPFSDTTFARPGDFAAAAVADAARGNFLNPSGTSTMRGVVGSRPLPSDRAHVIAAQRPVTAKALAEFPPGKKFTESLAALRSIHLKYRDIVAKTQDVLHQGANQKYRALVNKHSEAIIEGTAELPPTDPEENIAKGFEAQRTALAEAARKLGHQSIPHTRVVRDGIHGSLSKLISRLETADDEDRLFFGVPLGPRPAINLVTSVLIQFERRTHEICEFEREKPSAMVSCYAKDMFEDFLSELDTWNT